MYVKSIKDKKNSELSALEIINPQVSKTIWLDEKYYVLVEYENSTDWEITDKNEIKEIWAKRDACYPATVNLWYPQIEDPELHENIDELFKWCENNNIPVYGHIWIGVLHPHFNSEQKELMDDMYILVQELWWNVSWEHWIWKKKQKYLSEQEKNQIKSIKEKWDSNDVFGF
jgi:FAD/FMN-containing dehydrogenase